MPNSSPLIPTLRFPGFSGEWEERKLREIGENIIGLTYSPKDVTSEKDYPIVLRSSNIKESRLVLDDVVRVKSKISEKLYTKKDDILICTRNGSQNLIGKNTIIGNRNELTTFGAFMSVYRSDNNYFIVHLFKTDKYLRQVQRNLGARINQITTGYLNKFSFYFPQEKEQQKIAEFLESADSWIENLKEQKKSLEIYKKGMMQKIFAREIRFKDGNGKEFEEWKEKKLGDVFYSEKGSGLSKDTIVTDGVNDCILYGELYTTYKEVIYNISSKTNNNEGLKSQIGDLLIPCSTTTTAIDLANVTALNKDGILLGGDITVLRSKVKINNIFYAYYLSNYKKGNIAEYGQGSTIVHLYYNHFKKMNIDIPCYEEQLKIAEFLTSIDEFIDSKQEQIAKAEEWKKGLMQGLFV